MTWLIWTASSEFGTYCLCKQRRFRRACASTQSRQNLRCSLIQAVSQEELAHTTSESRGIFRQKARSLAPLNGWACAVKIYHDGMLEDTNSLDGAHLIMGNDTVAMTGISKLSALSGLSTGILRIEYKNLSCVWGADRKICQTITVWNHEALPSNAKRRSRETEFSICTKHPCLILFLAYLSILYVLF